MRTLLGFTTGLLSGIAIGACVVAAAALTSPEFRKFQNDLASKI